MISDEVISTMESECGFLSFTQLIKTVLTTTNCEFELTPLSLLTER